MPALLNPWAVYEHPAIAWDPHPAQELVLESEARHKVWCAGRRTGKSDLGGHKLLPEAIYTRSVAEEWKRKGKSRIFWIVSDEYTTAEKEFRVIWHLCNLLELPLDKPGSYYDAIGGNMHISLWNGAFQVHAQSAKYPEHLVGEALCGVIMAEAAKAKPSIWHRFIRPMLNDYQGWSLHTSTPLGHNHFYDKFQMGQDEFNPDWDSWRVPSWDNPFVHTETGRLIAQGKSLLSVNDIPREEFTKSEDVKQLLFQLDSAPGLSVFEVAQKEGLFIDSEILQLIEELPPDLFRQEIAADFTEFAGQVFKDFDEAYHVGDLRFDPDWETYAATDYGFTNPNVWLLIQVGPWQEINVLAEVYEEGLTAEHFAEEIKRRGLNPSGLRVFYPDPADPMSSRTLQERLRVMPTDKNTGGELNVRINLIRQALRKGRIDRSATGLNENNSDVWRPQLMFDRRGCPRTREDMLAYRYPERKEDAETSRDRFELPLKRDDHGPEALGRFMIGYFGDGSLIDTGTRVTKAKVGSGKKRRNGFLHRIKPESAMRPVKSGYVDWRSWQ